MASLFISYCRSQHCFTILNLNSCSVTLLITEASKCKIASLPIYTYSHTIVFIFWHKSLDCNILKVTEGGSLHCIWYLQALKKWHLFLQVNSFEVLEINLQIIHKHERVVHYFQHAPPWQPAGWELEYFSQQERDRLEILFIGLTVFKGMLKDRQILNK